MSASTAKGKAMAFFLAALIVLFAPLVHAMCVGQTHNATTSHVMPGGSTMVMTELSSFDFKTTSGFTSSFGSVGESILLALIAVCLAPAVRALLRLRAALRVARAFLRDNFRRVVLGLRPPPILHRPTMVDLLSLGISRT